MSRLPTGVAVLTTGTGESAMALTVNSLVSVSLNPPLIMVGLDQRSRALASTRAEGAFTLSILADDQADLSGLLASADRPNGRRLTEHLDARAGSGRPPVVPDAVAVIDCRLDAEHAVGDHSLLIGRVIGTERGRSDRVPLVFHQAAYRSLPANRVPGPRSVRTGGSEVEHAEEEPAVNERTCDMAGPTDVSIVGGGPPGLLLALLLARRGHRVSLLERSEAVPPRRVGPAPNLYPTTLRIFDRLGLLAPLTEDGQRIHGVEGYMDGRLEFRLHHRDVPGAAYPYSLSTPIGTLQHVLGAAAQDAGVTVIRGVEVSGLDRSDCSEQAVKLKTADGRGTSASRFIVGCDGKFSAVRTYAGIGADVREFRETYIRIRARRPETWPLVARAYMGGAGQAFVVPTPDNGLVVICAAHEVDGDTGRVVDALATIAPELDAAVKREDTSFEQIREIRQHIVRARKWATGNILLLGDSAHGVHSLGGQGMNLGLQDAVLLSQVLGNALETGDPTSIADYERIRRPYVEWFQRLQESALDESSPMLQSHFYQSNHASLVLGQLQVRGICDQVAA